MAKWINPVDNLPEIGKIVLVEMTGGDYLKKEYTGLDGWWVRNILRWLDESKDNTPSFSIEEMKNCWQQGHRMGYLKEPCVENYKSYMKEQYNIDL